MINSACVQTAEVRLTRSARGQLSETCSKPATPSGLFAAQLSWAAMNARIVRSSVAVCSMGRE